MDQISGSQNLFRCPHLLSEDWGRSQKGHIWATMALDLSLPSASSVSDSPGREVPGTSEVPHPLPVAPQDSLGRGLKGQVGVGDGTLPIGPTYISGATEDPDGVPV